MECFEVKQSLRETYSKFESVNEGYGVCDIMQGYMGEKKKLFFFLEFFFYFTKFLKNLF